MMSTKTKTAPLSSYRDPIILITGCVIGAILGLVFGDKVSFLKPIGQIFLNLLFCLIVPLIFFSIAGSIANTKDTGKVGKMIGLTLLIFVTTAILSAILILVVTHFTGVPTNFTAVTKNAAAAKPISVSDPHGRRPAASHFPLPRPAPHHHDHILWHLRLPSWRRSKADYRLDERHDQGLL